MMTARSSPAIQSLGIVGAAMQNPRPLGWTRHDEESYRFAIVVRAMGQLPLSDIARLYSELSHFVTNPWQQTTPTPVNRGGAPPKTERDLWICLLYEVAARANLRRGWKKAVKLRLGEIFGTRDEPLSESRIRDIVGDKKLRKTVAAMVDSAPTSPGLNSDLQRMTSNARLKYEKRL